MKRYLCTPSDNKIVIGLRRAGHGRFPRVRHHRRQRQYLQGRSRRRLQRRLQDLQLGLRLQRRHLLERRLLLELQRRQRPQRRDAGHRYPPRRRLLDRGRLQQHEGRAVDHLRHGRVRCPRRAGPGHPGRHPDVARLRCLAARRRDRHPRGAEEPGDAQLPLGGHRRLPPVQLDLQHHRPEQDPPLRHDLAAERGHHQGRRPGRGTLDRCGRHPGHRHGLRRHGLRRRQGRGMAGRRPRQHHPERGHHPHRQRGHVPVDRHRVRSPSRTRRPPGRHHAGGQDDRQRQRRAGAQDHARTSTRSAPSTPSASTASRSAARSPPAPPRARARPTSSPSRATGPPAPTRSPSPSSTTPGAAPAPPTATSTSPA